MKKLIFLFTFITMLLNFHIPVHAQSAISSYENIESSSVENYTFSNRFYESASEYDAKQSLKDKQAQVEAWQTGILISLVVLFLGAMFVVRVKIKKSINKKLN